MRLELCRSHLEILPEGEADLAYIEDTLGLRKAGNHIPLIRLDHARGRSTVIRLAAGSTLVSRRRQRQTEVENKSGELFKADCKAKPDLSKPDKE
jgi:hypothetical protein